MIDNTTTATVRVFWGALGAVALATASMLLGGARFGWAAPERKEEIPFSYSKLLIEHNATDEDTGFQLATDGEAWNHLEIRGPGGKRVLTVQARGRLRRVGFTEMFFETQEPENAEVPIPEMLANLPEGDYEFHGTSVDGLAMEGTATLTHAIPAGPVLISPMAGATVDPNADLEVTWQPVTQTIFGAPVDVTHYQLIVEEDIPFTHPGFGRSLYSVHVPASVTSLRVPAEFLAPGTGYKFEVLALEASGNQTLSSSEFETQ